jgi:hypothetical protein
MENVAIPMFEDKVSDHRPIAVRFSVKRKSGVSRVPNKEAAIGYMQRILNEKLREPTIQGLYSLVKEEIRAGRKPYKKIIRCDRRESKVTI